MDVSDLAGWARYATTCLDGLLEAVGSGDAHLLALVPFAIALLLALCSLPKPKASATNGGCPGGRADGVEMRDVADAFQSPQGAPDYPHIEAAASTGLFFSNAHEAVPFENEFCHGSFLPLHRPTMTPSLNSSGKYPYGEYFRDKKRVWEMRFQFKFTKPPLASKLYFGLELEQYVPVSAATKHAMDGTVAMFKRIIGNQLYHSCGDNPKKVHGSLERPVFVMPLWAYDQYIVTPEGETPPRLSDPELQHMGSKRAKRVMEFKREIDNIEFRTGPTYTFCFWGVSQHLDVVKWEIKGIPLMPAFSFNRFCGKPPVHLVLYALKSGDPDSSADSRHLQSRKNYYLRVAFWSSLKRPEPEVFSRLIEDLRPSALSPSHALAFSNRGRRGLLSRSFSWLACCADARGAKKGQRNG
mmetsp:Transcript_21108/g.59010  ORF Transcript_21108/g.59010 Transcript_21108/m.59010 type:complete len:412 (-) Transcript_21108:25-1260(-)